MLARRTITARGLLFAAIAPIGTLPALPGCASGPRAGEVIVEDDRYPSDFALAVTVLAPRMNDSPRIPAVRRPARYIVETDAVLRAAVGPGAREDTFPPIVRRLTHDEVQSLWLLAREGGLTDRGRDDQVGSPPSFEGATGRTRYVVWICASGSSRVLVMDAEQPCDATPLVDRLAALAKVPQPSGTPAP